MRYSTLLFVLMATLSSGLVLEKRETRTVNATNIEAASVQGCFPRGGERWGADRGYAYKYATRACAEALVGSYRPEDQRVKCYNLSSLKKVDFALELRADVVARGIDFPECYDGLMKDIRGCDHGGSTTYTHWIYRADPNAGQCA